MQRILLPSLLLASTTLTAQTTDMLMDSTTQRVTYEAVFDAPGSKAELFQRLKAWFDEFYPNAAGVITATDSTLGKIEADPKFTLSIEDKKGTSYNVGIIKYSLKVWVKDGKVRYKLTDIRLAQDVYYGIEKWMDPAHGDAENNPKKLEKVSAYVDALLADLKKFMTTVEEKKNEDEW